MFSFEVPSEGMSDVTFGERVKTLRASYELTQRQVAQVCGVTAAAVCDWEQGRREPPKANVVFKMSECFDDPDVLALAVSAAKDRDNLVTVEVTDDKLELFLRLSMAMASTSKAKLEKAAALVEA